MRKSFYKSVLVLFFVSLAFASCRTEESELIESPPEDVLVASSTVTRLMKNVSINDGSIDNIIDYANCFIIKLPVKVNANGQEITINYENDYKKIEYIFDDSDDDVDTISITYPIQIILKDFTEVVINNNTELLSYSSNCNGENEYDEDIECLDFNYPISAFIFNSNDEIIYTLQITNDSEIFNLIQNLDNFDFVSLRFPLTLTIYDGTELIINDLNQLETTIEAYKDSCDEDDDYDFNDDDCNDCNPLQLINILTNCSDWTVDKLKRYGNDYDDVYDGYTFNFQKDGTVSVYYSGGSAYGTWTASGAGNNITVTIDIPDLPYCNNDWILHEISEYSETKIDLRVGSYSRLRYENICN